MNTTPDPAFTSALEWQLRTELRRNSVPTAAGRRWPKGITLVAVALTSGLAGAACLGAAMQAQESRRGEVIVASLSLRETAAKQAAEAAQKMKENVEAMRAAGTVTDAEVRLAQARAEVAAATANLAALELAEAKASSRPARKEITAPKVNGRDFVAERLRIEQAQAALLAKAEVELRGSVRLRIAAGLASKAQGAQAELAADLRRREVELLADRLILRENYIAGKVTAERAEQDDLRERALAAVNAAEAKLNAAQQTFERITALHKAGTASSAELNEAQLLVANLRAELELAKAELAALKTADQPAK